MRKQKVSDRNLEVFIMLSQKIIKITTVAIASMGLLSIGASVTNAADFDAPKLGVANVEPTNPAIKKGDKVFVIIKDTKNQKVNVLNSNGTKTSKQVAMGSTYTAKAVKKVSGKKIVKIAKSQWLNTKDVVKN